MNLDVLVEKLIALSDEYKLSDKSDYGVLSAKTVEVVMEASKFGDAADQLAVDLIYLWQHPKVVAPFLDLKKKIRDALDECDYYANGEMDVRDSTKLSTMTE
jgi:hypothetical protein